MQGNHLIVRAAIALTIAAAALASMPWGAGAQGIPRDLADKLTPAQLTTYETYRTARDRFERQLKIYWHRVEAKRDARKAKRMLGQEYEAEDYIAVQPPKYAGPELPPEIAKIVTEVKPPVPERPLATVADFLASAKEQYGFVPTPTTERDFKRRYAQEALAVGLSKDQVVRIYALETGGQGTYDMQSGFNPITKTGRPISSALGYAQLLHANSTSELVKHGERFARRLLAMAATPGTPPERAEALKAKAAIVRRMLRAARSIPNEWSHHVRFAGTPPGLGIHALNLDADVGPWLQVLKLRGLKDDAANAGRGEPRRRRDRAHEPRRPPHRARDDDAGGPEHADLQLLQRGRLLPQHHRAREDGGRAAEGAQRPHGGQHQEAGRRRVRADLRRGGGKIVPSVAARRLN